mmetsp:Transcript_9276/g.16799  ORF Transcript_9276/g.16799 Transcript_9276/m.16799 type:complete len:160 (+) Transcript_9276:119-598(+)|eukprot:CAMPEP_0201599112 /NCGR_PEP_ID=MMETSP0492-20130828/698_1 /ASSEMBLY_ACC=CAM_ASM_000837 /TAXON_ID=420259 /ORGANISM="Thalassiosira gravida, Strain GMp14c1" /LENGTH=159 /DNA_ID=CAMNT_0048061641 /DNA_START=218 /DNA_END=697 /DNA_ORIENTATION=-
MWSSLSLATLRATSARGAPVMASAASRVPCFASRAAAARFASSVPYAVDAPDGDHDLQNLEESYDWAKRTIDVASAVEDADAITQMHESVLGSKLFAVDGPDGEHDLEDVEEHLAGVDKIIKQASVLENADEVRDEQHRNEEMRKKNYNPDADFYNQKY